MSVGLFTQFGSLEAAYKKTSPEYGGVYSEGVVGELTNFNPIYASGDANQIASRLMFSSLYKYDSQGKLVADLASDLQISQDGMVYTVKLKEGILWHDDRPMGADDIVFTFRSIQNPDTRSPLADSWINIKIEKVSNDTVRFTLPNRFAPFQHSLVTGIIPKHAFDEVATDEIRNSEFNQAPIGSGPFKFRGLDVESGQLELVRNADYYAKPPYLNHFVINSFDDVSELENEFANGTLTGVVDVQGEISQQKDEYNSYHLPMTNSVFAFMNNSRRPLKDVSVRKALVSSVDRADMIKDLGLNEGVSRGPILAEHNGFTKSNLQKESDLADAAKVLQDAGWKKSKDGIRRKDGKQLVLKLVSQNSGEFPEVSKKLAERWSEIGVKVDVSLYSLDELRANYIATHDYDILLFGIALGADPDVFAYWHSSQAIEGGFNFSEYKSKLADESLEAGRTRVDERLRREKYKAFTEQWNKDYPAVALYRTSLNYYQSKNVIGFETRKIIDPVDRFNNVQDWAVNKSSSLRATVK